MKIGKSIVLITGVVIIFGGVFLLGDQDTGKIKNGNLLTTGKCYTQVPEHLLPSVNRYVKARVAEASSEGRRVSFKTYCRTESNTNILIGVMSNMVGTDEEDYLWKFEDTPTIDVNRFDLPPCSFFAGPLQVGVSGDVIFYQCGGGDSGSSAVTWYKFDINKDTSPEIICNRISELSESDNIEKIYSVEAPLCDKNYRPIEDVIEPVPVGLFYETDLSG